MKCAAARIANILVWLAFVICTIASFHEAFAQKSEISVIAPDNLTCEYLRDPMAVDVTKPRLSWVNTAAPDSRGQLQTAYQIQVASTKDKLLAEQADLWDTGKVNSSESMRVRFGGKELVSREDCWWHVRTWDRDGKVSPWSQPAFWTMGLLNPADWKAKWVGAPWQGEDASPSGRGGGRGRSSAAAQIDAKSRAPLLRKHFSVDKKLASARAYVTGLGYFDLYVNGKKASEDVLVPNFTNFGKRPGLERRGIPVEDNFAEYRVMYLCYDIKDLLKDGNNVVGAILGNGFFDSPSNWTASYGSPRFLGQIHLTFTDGTQQVITSDESWKAAPGPILFDTVYGGEHYDAREEKAGWNAPGFDDSLWEAALLRKAPEGKMVAHMSPTDRVTEKLAPVKIEKIRDAVFRVDFGKEISGWLHLTGIKGEPGTKIDIRYLENNGTTAGSGTNSYTLNGSGAESYAARFTWFVFRYAEISNWPGELTADQVQAEAVNTNVGLDSEFVCSNDLFNKINQIWQRSQIDNMHGGIASDCPHRERSPYTGDGQVVCVTVMHNFDAAAFYNKWIQDIVGAQNVNTGYVPNGAPWQPGCGGGVAWGAAINIMPWEYYLHYGDRDMLAYTYEGMKGYIKYMLTWTNQDGIMHSRAPDPARPNNWMNLGDWCAPGRMPPDELVHTFYLWRCADFTSKTAKVLGRDTEAEQYAKLAEKTKDAFHKKYYDAAQGTYGAGGGNVFALKMGVPDEHKPRVLAALKADIVAAGGHLDTGIFATQFLFETLADYGLNDVAFHILDQRTQPSFGYWIDQGATTTWERWNGGGSRNHPMFGGGLVWLYRKLAGMDTDVDQPGYKHIVFRPQPVGDAAFCEYQARTIYGKGGIRWEKKDGKMTVDVTVPVGSTATVYVPATQAKSVTESGQAIAGNTFVQFQKMDDGYAVYSVPQGQFHFATE